MTAAAASFRTDVRVISLVGIAHGFSHFFQLCLPPLFPLLKDEFGGGYAVLGAVMAVFYAVSGIMQTAAGFLVDRFGARVMLLAGMALISGGTVLAGLVPGFEWLFLAAALAGLGNSVFHPADLALLNGKVDPQRLGHAFSVHGLTGNVGWALGPLFVVPIAAAHGWRTALVAAGVLGFAYLAILATQRVLGREVRRVARVAGRDADGWRRDVTLLASEPVVLCFLFFALYSTALLAFQMFAPVALTQLYGVTLGVATGALTGFLLGGAAGIVAGGFVAVRTQRHNLVAAAGVLLPAALALVIATAAVPTTLLVALMILTGFLFGSIGPSRDIIVRGIAPVEARGKVYGFVYSGLDLSGLLAPPIFGWALDHGRPSLVFAGAAVFMVAAVVTVLRVRREPRRAPVAA